jgi:hypothetical protein
LERLQLGVLLPGKWLKELSSENSRSFRVICFGEAVLPAHSFCLPFPYAFPISVSESHHRETTKKKQKAEQ